MRVCGEGTAWCMVAVGLVVELVTHSLAVGLKMPYRALVVVILGSLGFFMLGMGIVKLRSIIIRQISDDGLGSF